MLIAANATMQQLNKHEVKPVASNAITRQRLLPDFHFVIIQYL